MNWRDKQLSWYKADILLQDQQLLDFVKTNSIKDVRYLGDSAFLVPVIGQPTTGRDMIIYVVNTRFTFHEVIERCNQALHETKWLYLSINKFLAEPKSDATICEDYDQAILDLMQERVNGQIIRYYSGKDDGGTRFNWAHPITRFYFENASARASTL